MPEPSIDRVTVTPDLAHEWLTRNTHNRRQRLRVSKAFAADMVEGNWRWNGETIKFAVDGTLLDGQHRLAAVILAGIPIDFLVVRGLPNEVQQTMDGGVKRKFSDVLELRGEKHYTTLASAARRVSLWETGEFRASNVAPTNAQLLAVIEKYPELREYAAAADYLTTKCAFPPSVLGWAMWLLHRIDSQDATYFFDRLGSDQEHQAGDPVYELRKAGENNRNNVKGARNITYLAAITIKAWNAYRDGNRVGVLSYRPGGAKPERFPEPR